MTGRTAAADDAAATAAAIRSGDRRALARGITLVESTRQDHRPRAEALLAALLPAAGGAFRLGVSGAPGVGKSTLIQALGLLLVERGMRLAVLAVDPTSGRTGGSILGDKTRMGDLARSERAFIRPSPAGATLGGVARRTREAIVLCEASGADVVIVETVGVGQSETAVAGMTDLFLLVVAPGGGDDLQGIKRGIMELADAVCVNKADGDLEPAARRAVADYRAALRLMHPRHPELTPLVHAVSALTGTGLPALWEALARSRAALDASGALGRQRADQARGWMWNEVREGLLARARSASGARARELEEEVAAGRMLPAAAADAILADIGLPSGGGGAA
jgi:LAO/AO transport system kinase